MGYKDSPLKSTSQLFKEPTVAHHKDAIKRIRQNKRRRTYNRYYISTMRTTIKKFHAAIEEGNTELASELFPKTVKIVQKLGGKGIIHKKQASRRVARLHATLKKLETA